MLLNTYQLAILNIYWNVLNKYEIYNDVILKHSEIHIFTEISETIISEIIQETLKSYIVNLLFERNIWNYYCINDFFPQYLFFLKSFYSFTYYFSLIIIVHDLFILNSVYINLSDLFILFRYFLRKYCLL